MKGLELDIEWRTVQLFVSDEGVSEVEVDSDNPNKVRCTCTNFKSAARCKHTRFIKKAMEENNGHYNIQIPSDVPDEEAVIAMLDRELFRKFIIKYAKVEVL